MHLFLKRRLGVASVLGCDGSCYMWRCLAGVCYIFLDMSLECGQVRRVRCLSESGVLLHQGSVYAVRGVRGMRCCCRVHQRIDPFVQAGLPWSESPQSLFVIVTCETISTLTVRMTVDVLGVWSVRVRMLVPLICQWRHSRSGGGRFRRGAWSAEIRLVVGVVYLGD